MLRKLLLAALVMFYGGAALAETVTGLIVEDGVGSLRIKADDGRELHLYMKKGMDYEPSDYRAYQGDRVEVTFEPVVSRRTGEEKPGMTRVKLVKLDPANAELPSPQEGVVTEMGRRGAKVRVASRDKVFTFEYARGTPKVANAITPKEGDRVLVVFDRVPGRFGNYYAYQFHGFQAVK
jgi:hypothetical protein